MSNPQITSKHQLTNRDKITKTISSGAPHRHLFYAEKDVRPTKFHCVKNLHLQ
jgi:hypothetical protein